MREPVTVVGGSVAALVAADRAAANGRDVALHLPRKGVGGGFAPLKLDGRYLERGIRLLELRYENVGEPPPLADYAPGWAGHRPYARLVEAWADDLLGAGLVEVDRPLMFAGGRLLPEIQLSSDLSALAAALDPSQAAAIAEEAAAALERFGDDAGILHPDREGELWSQTFVEASLANHGRTFHELFIEPLCRKIRPEGGDDVIAALRRKIWMPLFWPRTLAEAARGERIGFVPDRPFHTVSPGGTGEIVRRLLARLEVEPRVRISHFDELCGLEPADGGGVWLDLGESGTSEARRPILGVGAPELFGAVGVPYAADRVESFICWVEVSEDDLLLLPSMVHVVDEDVALFRLTAGEPGLEPGRRILTLELRHGTPEADAPAAAREGLERLGLLSEGAPIEFLAFFAGKTFNAPTAVNRSRFEDALGAFHGLGLDVEVVGGANHFGADALNEQVVQGLRAAALAG